MFAVCDIPASQPNGGYNLSLDRMSITYYCEPGFTLKGNFLRHCQLNSMGWDGADPTCGECECFKSHVPRRYFFCGSFMFLLCLVFAMFCARLFICASWSPAGKGLTSWLSFVVSSVSLSLSHWYPGSGVVLDCIDS